MNNTAEKLIDDLVIDLKPVKRLLKPSTRASLWLVFCILVSIFLVSITGTYRDGFQADLISSPRFLIETISGFLSGIVAAYYAFELVVPNQRWSKHKKLLSILPFLIFILLSLYSIFNPALPPSWSGWRQGCERDILLYGSIPMLLFFILANKAAPTEKEWTGILIGISAMAPSAALMQLACMYNPWHFLGFHVAPVILIALIGARLGKMLLKL